MSISALLLVTYVIYTEILCFTCFFVVWGSKWRRSFTWHTAARTGYWRFSSEQHGVPGAVRSLHVYGIYCEHFWYHNDSRQFRCHPWLMWSNISYLSDVPGTMSAFRQQHYKRNRIPVATANGTEIKTTGFLPYIIHRKHKVYSWQLYVYRFPLYIQSQVPLHNSSINTPTLPWSDIPESSGNGGNPRHRNFVVTEKTKAVEGMNINRYLYRAQMKHRSV